MCEAGPALRPAPSDSGSPFAIALHAPCPPPPIAGLIITGDGSYVAPDDWNLVRPRLGQAKSYAKKKLKAAKASGTGVAAAQAVFSAADAAYAAHAAKPHVRGKSYPAK